MSRRFFTLFLMLVAGAATCVLTFVLKYSTLEKLIALLIVLIVFYVIGSLFVSVLDSFEKQNEERLKQEKENQETEQNEGEQKE